MVCCPLHTNRSRFNCDSIKEGLLEHFIRFVALLWWLGHVTNCVARGSWSIHFFVHFLGGEPRRLQGLLVLLRRMERAGLLLCEGIGLLREDTCLL